MASKRTENHSDQPSRRHSRRAGGAHDRDERTHNGASEAGTAATGEQPAAATTQEAGGDDATMHRAEQLVDEWGQRVGHFATQAGHYFLRWASRAREEAEDMWAEAQAIRQGDQHPNP